MGAEQRFKPRRTDCNAVCQFSTQGESTNDANSRLHCAASAYRHPSTSSAFAQSRPLRALSVREIYTRLLPQIEKIPIFDHHAHPGFPDDPDVDAMAAPPGSAPLRERDTQSRTGRRRQGPLGLSLRRSFSRARQVAGQQKGGTEEESKAPPTSQHLLDKLNIDQGVANRAMMADYLDPKRFLWVFFADSFMWPFDNKKETRPQRRRRGLHPAAGENAASLDAAGKSANTLPASFDDYLKFVTQMLEDNQKNKGCHRDEIRSRLLPPAALRRSRPRAGRSHLQEIRQRRRSV